MAHRIGLGRRSTALLETTGRKRCEPRITPVTNALDDDVFWIVSEHGHRANYVQNIEAAGPGEHGGGWRSGVAKIVDENPERELQQIVSLNARARANAQIVRKTGNEHLVIQIGSDGNSVS
jgi:deazaflavin-dependent oxidoreductase (nitroreductase family)